MRLRKRRYLRFVAALVCYFGLPLIALAQQMNLDTRAQSAFRFRSIPEFMFLRIRPGAELTGRTVSLWRENVSNYVIGKIIDNRTIELTIYPSNDAWWNAQVSADEKCRKQSDRWCRYTAIRNFLGDTNISAASYKFDEQKRFWRMEEDYSLSDTPYTDFEVEKEYYPRGVEASIVADSKSHVGRHERPFLASIPVDDLFERDIIQYIAGVNPGMVDFGSRPERCQSGQLDGRCCPRRESHICRQVEEPFRSRVLLQGWVLVESLRSN
jgi:hypothetical protein